MLTALQQNQEVRQGINLPKGSRWREGDIPLVASSPIERASSVRGLLGVVEFLAQQEKRLLCNLCLVNTGSLHANT